MHICTYVAFQEYDYPRKQVITHMCMEFVGEIINRSELNANTFYCCDYIVMRILLNFCAQENDSNVTNHFRSSLSGDNRSLKRQIKGAASAGSAKKAEDKRSHGHMYAQPLIMREVWWTGFCFRCVAMADEKDFSIVESVRNSLFKFSQRRAAHFA